MRAVALDARHRRVQRRGAGRVKLGRVDQHPLGAVGLAHQQCLVLLVRLAAGEEGARAPPGRGADGAGPLQLGQPRGEPVAAGQGVQRGARQLVLGLGPGLGPRVGRVLQPPVRVGHLEPVQLLDQVEPLGRRVVGAGGARVLARVGHGVRG